MLQLLLAIVTREKTILDGLNRAQNADWRCYHNHLCYMTPAHRDDLLRALQTRSERITEQMRLVTLAEEMYAIAEHAAKKDKKQRAA